MFEVQNLIGVVVTYNIKVQETLTLLTLNDAAAYAGVKLDMIIYDNSNAPQAVSADLFSNLNCTYYHDTSNPGVSAAYNFAANEGRKRNKKFILLLDQDTSFPADTLLKYMEGLNSNANINLLCPILHTPKGIFSPSKYYFRRGVIWKNVEPGKYRLKNRSALNSGMLINLDAYHSIGGYNPDIQLYFSDFDFLNRFKKRFQEMVVLDIRCTHTLSDIVKGDLFSAVSRFTYYVHGSYNSVLCFKDYSFLFLTILLRSLKLSLQYRNTQFLSIFFKKYLIERIF
ncbi:glycosyltransferase [Segetibacter sp. 3557_3]|uniref:glycosyltransferase n=1 Tax=Segetibacter sp. 3557_3 TaxID=2547429 RepID=UPI001058DE4A|nr:glycosyltransferase [Segetibacter sp. 3557_3]TDH23326.1 glycosyltransferase [Segetibacter sp. 3557_3]